MDETLPNVVASALDFAKTRLMPPPPEKVQVRIDSDAHVVFAPNDLELHDLTKLVQEHADQPPRMKGTTVLRTVGSFTDWVRRQKQASTCIYAKHDPREPSLTAIIDHAAERPNAEGTWAGAHWQQYRATVPLKLSQPWLVWERANEKYLDQSEFASFIEDRFGDLLVPPRIEECSPQMLSALSAVQAKAFADPMRMLEVARGLELTSGQAFKNKVNLSTGETQMVFESSINEAEQLKIPQAFLIALPVFEGTPAFQMPVRLRIRTSGSKVVFAPFLYRIDLVLEQAFQEAVQKVRETLPDVPVFEGIAP